MSVRRARSVAAALAATLLLAACGDAGAEPGDEPSATGSPSATAEPDDAPPPPREAQVDVQAEAAAYRSPLADRGEDVLADLELLDLPSPAGDEAQLITASYDQRSDATQVAAIWMVATPLEPDQVVAAFDEAYLAANDGWSSDVVEEDDQLVLRLTWTGEMTPGTSDEEPRAATAQVRALPVAVDGEDLLRLTITETWRGEHEPPAAVLAGLADVEDVEDGLDALGATGTEASALVLVSDEGEPVEELTRAFTLPGDETDAARADLEAAVPGLEDVTDAMDEGGGGVYLFAEGVTWHLRGDEGYVHVRRPLDG